MEIFINGSARPDIRIEAGGGMEMENSHTATSSIKISLPSASEPVSECDFIQFKEMGKNIYSGTIMQIRQTTFPLQTLSFKSYSLTISDNSELLAAVFVDMTFTPGANMMQILYGNKPGSKWYDQNMPEFYGISQRLINEGLEIGIIDDFSRYILSEPANLWGMYIRDALNSLSEIAGAWWEITPDKVFNMRYPVSSASAPVNITDELQIFNVNVSRDAFTLYSAVRVMGGRGVGNQLPTMITPLTNNMERNTAIAISDTIIQTKYPIHKLYGSLDLPNLKEGRGTITCISGLRVYTVLIGIKGLDDGDPQYDGYYTSGSDKIELNSTSSNRFPEMNNVLNSIGFSYSPYVPVYARLEDDDLVKELKEQRGGTGVIEQLIEDNSIKSFSDAVAAAKAFLEESKKRAFTVDFSTFIPGWEVGQTLSINLPYYEIAGEFNIVSVKKVPILRHDQADIIQYDVSASTVALREKYGELFYTPKSVAFTLGTDFPNVQSSVFDNTIELKTTVTWQKIKYTQWTSLENNTWSVLMTQYNTWGDFQETEDQQLELNGLTETGKDRFAYASGGKSKEGAVDLTTAPDLCHTLTALSASGKNPLSANSVILTPGSDITSTFYIGPDELKEIISGFGYFDGNEAIQSFPISFDKSDSNLDGNYGISLSIKQHFTGKWLTESGKNALLRAIQNTATTFPLDSGIYISYINQYGDHVTSIEQTKPNEVGNVLNGNYTVSYYVDENEINGTIKALNYSQNDDTMISIETNIDHSEDNPSGKYDLALAVTHSFI